MLEKFTKEQLREAMTRSEFPEFFRKGLKSRLFKGYKEYAKIYEDVVTFETSDRDKEYYPATGEAPNPELVFESEEYKESGIVDETITITNFKYGRILAITKEMIEDEQTRQLRKLPAKLGGAHARFENETVFTFYNDGDSDTCYDAQNYFDTAGHPDVTGGSAVAANTNNGGLGALSEANLETALTEMALWRGRQGETILVRPMTLLVAPNQEWIARRLLGSSFEVNPTTNINVGHVMNAHQNSMRLIVAPWLTATTWYIVTDIEGLIYQWREKLNLTTENKESGDSFIRDVYRYKSSTRFGLDAIDWRFGYKGN